jgi:hypothetical protein
MEREISGDPEISVNFSTLVEEKETELRHAFKIDRDYMPQELVSIPKWFKSAYDERVVPSVVVLNHELIKLVIAKNEITHNTRYVELWLKGPEVITFRNGVSTRLNAFNISLFNARGDEPHNTEVELTKLKSYIPFSEDSTDIQHRMENAYRSNMYGVRINECEYRPISNIGVAAKDMAFSNGFYAIRDDGSPGIIVYPDLLLKEDLDEGCFRFDWWVRKKKDNAINEALGESFLTLAHHYAHATKYIEWAKMMQTSRFAERLELAK